MQFLLSIQNYVYGKILFHKLYPFIIADNKQYAVKMPVAIERSVRRQNIKFMHNRNQFSLEYFQFMKKLIMCNGPYVTIPGGQEKLVSAFSFLLNYV